jgi:O-antigen/teichoic acid export membrane protein
MTEPSERHEQHDLGGRVTRGAGWVIASQVPTQILGFVTSIVVARLLGPFDVGVAVEAVVFANLALIFADFGFAAVIIQRPVLTEEDRSTAFWVGVSLGTGLMLLGIGLSWPIAALYDQPLVQPLFAVLSVTFLFSALGIVQGALLVRDMRFRSLQTRTVIATAVSCAAGITAAALGAGSWAIVTQHLVITAVSTALLWRASSWRPRPMFSRKSLREMAGYSSNVLGVDVLGWATVSLDNFLIGRYLGAAPLGAYSIAYSVMTTPLKRIASPLSTVFFPAFSAMQDHARIAAGWLRANGMVALVVVPLTLGMIPAAPDLVAAVFGPEWEQAAELIQILAVVGMLQALAGLCDGVLQAIDRTRELFRFTLILSVLSVGAFAAALPWGVDGVAWAFLGVTVVMQPALVVLTARQLGADPWDWLRGMAGVLQAGVVMLAAVYAVREALPDDLGSGYRLVAMIVTGALVYLPLVRWRFPQAMEEINLVRARRRGAPEPA